jgi:hypothetical protein
MILKNPGIIKRIIRPDENIVISTDVLLLSGYTVIVRDSTLLKNKHIMPNRFVWFIFNLRRKKKAN